MSDTIDQPRIDAAERPLLTPGVRVRDLAATMGVSEAELVARHGAPEVTPLGNTMRELVLALPSLGEVMALVRNDAAVHEKVGAFGNISLGDTHGLVLNGAIDQRLFLSHWRHAFAVELPAESGPRRSLQVFDAFGDAVVKIHLRPGSDVAAFEALRDRLAAPAAPLKVLPRELAPSTTSDIDVEAFRRAFEGMQDIHEFFPLLKRFAVSRRSALDLLDPRHARRLPEGAAQALIERAAESGLPIMCFVGSRGCIQIHSGPIANVRVIGPWLNILDPGFNLHLRADLVAEGWVVSKPTRYGLITSVELYDRDGELITQVFGVREPSSAERADWRALAESLLAEAA